MISILEAIVGLGLLIVLHEGGHFLAARLCGMRVERFSIGFGPTLLGFKRGDTLFQIAPIPLGGFVQITGLNPNEEFDKNDPFVYPNRPRWMRLAVILAGPAANYVTAIVLMFAVLLAFGMPSKTQKIIEPVAGKPAAVAGLKAGDVLVSANGQAVSADSPISEMIRAGQGAPVTIDVKRDGQPLSFVVKPEKQPSGALQVGIQIGPVDERTPVSAGAAIKEAVVYPYYASIGIVGNLVDMIRGRLHADLSGPIGITQQIAKAAERGASSFFEMVILLSVYLGVFNLLPLPSLDGGRATFLVLEWIRRRAVPPRIEAAVHTAGFMLLLGVLFFVSFKDIRHLFGKG
ncbi:MAG: rane-associated zinc metalloprotease [Myxococcales bacterium]|nr:rane-associated zinc metalloprotease [Myxococcales bacterium]